MRNPVTYPKDLRASAKEEGKCLGTVDVDDGVYRATYQMKLDGDTARDLMIAGAELSVGVRRSIDDGQVQLRFEVDFDPEETTLVQVVEQLDHLLKVSISEHGLPPYTIRVGDIKGSKLKFDKTGYANGVVERFRRFMRIKASFKDLRGYFVGHGITSGIDWSGSSRENMAHNYAVPGHHKPSHQITDENVEKLERMFGTRGSE